MLRLIFDIETNGLLKELTKVHCLVVRNYDTGETFDFADQPNHKPISEGLALLSTADMLIGHNIIRFDLPALEKVYGWKPKAGCVLRDTMVEAYVIWSDIKQDDFRRQKTNPKFPSAMIGNQSLASWGHRLGILKGEFDGPWDMWSPTMHSYMLQDSKVTDALAHHIEKFIDTGKRQTPQSVLDVEHIFAWLMFQQEQMGFPFNRKGAEALYATISAKRAIIEQELLTAFPPWFVRNGSAKPDAKSPATVTPKRDINYKDPMKACVTAGAPYTKIKLVSFNPSSRDHIARCLRYHYKWEPTEFTNDGNPKVDEDTLADLPWPEIPKLVEYLMLDKRCGQIAEGDSAWLKLFNDATGCIHGEVVSNGTPTARCRHKKPNVGQTPSVKNQKGVVPYGKECRQLFHVPKGYKLVGVDASGLELRCLAHYTFPLDGGRYANIVLSGDVHTENQKAAGLSDRPKAKRFIYAFLYGAGDELLGVIALGPLVSAKKAKAEGRNLRARFIKNIPALGRLIAALEQKLPQGWLRGIDGRVVPIRHKHAVLNSLLQSAGAIAVKHATVLFYQEAVKAGFVFGEDFRLCAHVHDEMQIAAKEEHADTIGKLAAECIAETGRRLGFRVPLAGEYKIGDTWAETH